MVDIRIGAFYPLKVYQVYCMSAKSIPFSDNIVHAAYDYSGEDGDLQFEVCSLIILKVQCLLSSNFFTNIMY